MDVRSFDRVMVDAILARGFSLWCRQRFSDPPSSLSVLSSICTMTRSISVQVKTLLALGRAAEKTHKTRNELWRGRFVEFAPSTVILEKTKPPLRGTSVLK